MTNSNWVVYLNQISIYSNFTIKGNSISDSTKNGSLPKIISFPEQIIFVAINRTDTSYIYKMYATCRHFIEINNCKYICMLQYRKCKMYLCIRNGDWFEALEAIVFKNKIPFTWILHTKTVKSNQVKPTLHLPLTFYHSHFWF